MWTLLPVALTTVQSVKAVDGNNVLLFVYSILVGLSLILNFKGTYIFLVVLVLTSFESAFCLDFPWFTCFQIPVLFTSSDMLIDVKGIFMMLPLINGICKFSWYGGGFPLLESYKDNQPTFQYLLITIIIITKYFYNFSYK